MMSVYLYAVCDADAAVVPAARPQSCGELRLVTSDGLAALVGERDELPLDTPSIDELWEHERVVEQLMSSCDVLPARFGSGLEDSDAVAELLRTRHDELAEGLRRVHGAAELAVRASLSSTPDSEVFICGEQDHRGTAYMAAALAREHRVRALADTIDRALGSVAREGRMRPLVRPSPGCAGAYLVPRDRLARFRAGVDRLDAELGDVELTCTGPWPPYSFTQSPEAGR